MPNEFLKIFFIKISKQKLNLHANQAFSEQVQKLLRSSFLRFSPKGQQMNHHLYQIKHYITVSIKKLINIYSNTWHRQ